MHAIRPHREPFVVVPGQPNFVEITKTEFLQNVSSGKMAVITAGRGRLGMEIEFPRCFSFQQESRSVEGGHDVRPDKFF
jgi:hypothetical protein